MEHTIQALQGTAAFAGVSEAALAFLLERAAVVERRAGELFFAERDFGDAFYLLERGRVDIYKTREGVRRDIGSLGEGECFGEMALLSATDRSATVVAATDCVALELSNRALRRLYRRDTAQFAMIMMNLGREVVRRLRELNDRLLDQAIAKGRADRLTDPAKTA